MLEPFSGLIILVVAFVATLLSSMSGGGSSMITTPIWLVMGYPLPVAIANNTITGSVWTLVAARSYLRGHQVDWKLIAALAAFGLIGAACATRVIISADPKLLQKVFGVIILALVLLVYFKRDFGLEAREPRVGRLPTGVCALALGFYEAFFGSGNGLFTSAVLCTTRGCRLIEALGYYYLISCVWCLFASSVYVAAGHWSAWLICFSLVGSVAGATLGSRIGSRKGSRFVKNMFLAVGTILACVLIVRGNA